MVVADVPEHPRIELVCGDEIRLGTDVALRRSDSRPEHPSAVAIERIVNVGAPEQELGEQNRQRLDRSNTQPAARADDILPSHVVHRAEIRVIGGIELVERAHMAAWSIVAARVIKGDERTRAEARLEGVAAVGRDHPRTDVLAAERAKLARPLQVEVETRQTFLSGGVMPARCTSPKTPADRLPLLVS
jgi:hypothetical protein